MNVYLLLFENTDIIGGNRNLKESIRVVNTYPLMYFFKNNMKWKILNLDFLNIFQDNNFSLWGQLKYKNN